ncbi:MAG: hypothetical protein Q9208_005299 [Pyrenodesmia sp. 3 TL-2023]
MRWSWVRRFSTTPSRLQGNLQPTTTINNHRETILLYRALLRQCTYLPDPAARKYVWSHIVRRFRAYQPIVRDNRGRPVRRKINKKDPLKALKHARKSLKYLQRANDGHMPHLSTVLDMTYGRVGKRRRLLMAKLGAPSIPMDPVSTIVQPDQETQHSAAAAAATRKVPQLSDELQALVKSQARQDSSRFDIARPKGIQPKVPATNSWGRPFPQNRKANFIRKWYATTLERLVPPLPSAEWERLRGLASGEIPWDGPVPQRKLGTTDKQTDPVQNLAAQFVLRDSIPHRLTSSNARVVEKGRHEEIRTNPHQLTPRFMRRMWSKVFWKCPRLDWSEEKQKYLVTWGRMGKPSKLVFDPQKAISSDLFDGVDEHGQSHGKDLMSSFHQPVPQPERQRAAV